MPLIPGSLSRGVVQQHNSISMGSDVTCGAAHLDRRQFLQLSGAVLASVPLACGAETGGLRQEARNGRLLSRPGTPGEALPAGRNALGLGGSRDGYIYVPSGYQHSKPAPMLLACHGAGRQASEWTGAFAIADELGVILVAPTSRAATWDRTYGSFGADVALIDAALERVFRGCNVDPARCGFAGFSDGASYALSLGLTNGDFLTHVLAFSPGFFAPGELRGKPRVYVTHGTKDNILPIDSTSRRIVPLLKSSGYDVRYQEFDGGHQLTPELGREVFRWFAESG
jgi:phospholipase/carboxylesterase